RGGQCRVGDVPDLARLRENHLQGDGLLVITPRRAPFDGRPVDQLEDDRRRRVDLHRLDLPPGRLADLAEYRVEITDHVRQVRPGLVAHRELRCARGRLALTEVDALAVDQVRGAVDLDHHQRRPLDQLDTQSGRV